MQPRSGHTRASRLSLQSLALLLALVCSAGTLQGAETSPLEFAAVGWNGVYQVGRWAPFTVELAEPLSSEVTQFEIDAPDADGNRVVSVFAASEVRDSQPGRYRLRFRAAQIEPTLVVRALDSEGNILARGALNVRSRNADETDASAVRRSIPAIQPLRQSIRLLASAGLGRDQIRGVSVDDDGTAVPALADWEVILLDRLEALPIDSLAWDALDLLVLAGEFGLTPQQNTALETWVLAGGHLVVSVSPGTRSDFAGSPLAEWLPVALEDELRLRELSAVEAFLGRGDRLVVNDRVPAIRLNVSRGTELINSINGPIAVRAPHGFGRVTVLGFELQSPPVSNWKSFAPFFETLVDPKSLSAESGTGSNSNQLTNSGVSELATQLQFSQQQFPNVKSYTSWQILGWILAYAVLIGPLDYLLAHRVWKRPQITWVTFPLQVICVAAIAINLQPGGAAATANQIDLIDVDQSRRIAEVRSWLTLHAPDSRRGRLEVESTLPALRSGGSSPTAREPLEIDWTAIPEVGFRGLYRPAGFEFSTPAYRRAPDRTAFENLPIEQGSTRSLAARQLLQDADWCDSDLTASTLGTISGSVEHRLPGKLSEWLLVYRNRVYFPRTSAARPQGATLAANQPIEITRGDISQSRDLYGFLTGTFQTRLESSSPSAGPQILVQRQKYDPLATEPLPILRMLTFHKAVQGADYTTLRNDALARMDWTGKLDPFHAVLIGRLELDKSPVGWNWDGTPVEAERRISVVRLLLPVSLLDDSRRELPNFDPNAK